MFAYGETQAKKAKDNSLNSYVEQFRGENYKDVLTMEVVTDTKSEFEIKVRQFDFRASTDHRHDL